jgi:hypothetical protein
MNYHIEQAGSSRRVKNFGEDIKDSTAYILVLSQVDKRANREALKELDDLKRAKKFLETADRCGVKKFINERDIVDANSRLNFAFVANMFAKYTVEVEDEPEPEVRLPPPFFFFFFCQFLTVDHHPNESRHCDLDYGPAGRGRGPT